MFSLYQWLLKLYLKPIEKAREAVCLLLLSATCMDSLARRREACEKKRRELLCIEQAPVPSISIPWFSCSISSLYHIGGSSHLTGRQTGMHHALQYWYLSELNPLIAPDKKIFIRKKRLIKEGATRRDHSRLSHMALKRASQTGLRSPTPNKSGRRLFAGTITRRAMRIARGTLQRQIRGRPTDVLPGYIREAGEDDGCWDE